MTDTVADPFASASEPNYLEELVGEGKKFATAADLAKGKFHADTMIETLKAEITALKANNANGMNVEALMNEIKKLQSGTTQENEGQPPAQTETNPPAQTNIEDLVLQTLEKERAKQATLSNKQTVINKMNEVWGADAPKELKKTADRLGVSVEYLNTVAAQSAPVFFQLTGLNADRSVPSGTTVPTSKVAVGVETSKKRDAAYYRELKKNNPSLYKSQQVQVQMHKDALALGEDYFN